MGFARRPAIYLDLDLTRDTNGDGDATNDADYTGSTLAISFDDVGKARFAVTVYDQSNNTDFEIFEIQVKEPLVKPE